MKSSDAMEGKHDKKLVMGSEHTTISLVIFFLRLGRDINDLIMSQLDLCMFVTRHPCDRGKGVILKTLRPCSSLL